MRLRLVPFALVMSLLFFRSSPIRAEVLAVSVSPASPIVNQPATVTVTGGQGRCGAVLVDFGDGVAQTYAITGLPFSTQHTWATTGAKTVTATGQGNCTGQANLTVLVTQLLGRVLAVSVAPASPGVNQAATVTITGQNPCGAAIINFGERGIASTTRFTSLPFSTQHTWTTPGTKTVTAIGQGGCTGHAAQTVQVTQSSNILQLCARLDCGERPKMFFLKPEINALFGFSTPGGILALAGKNFGTKPGSVVASLHKWSGEAMESTLEVIEWTNTMVSVRWPANISGVRPQPGTLVLTTAGGGKSDPRSVTFSPELDFRTLPKVDVQVLSCGNDGNYDQCNGVQDDDDRAVIGNPNELQSFIHGIVGTHVNAWAAVGNDTGTDAYRIVLRNDWTLESLHWAVSVEAEQGWAKKPGGFAKGANWAPSVQWLVTPNDRVSYFAVITITGPIGVPHK